MLDFARLRTLPGLLAYHAETRPDAVALEFEARKTAYSALNLRTTAIAGWLRQAGITPGTRIAYLGKNSDRYFELLFGAAKAGAVLVPLNWRLTSTEWTFILRDAGASHLFADTNFEEQAITLAQALAIPAISLDREDHWHALTNPGEDCDSAPDVQPDDVVVQIYTSGTTGTPKGAMLTHKNLLALREPGLRAGLAWFPRAEDTSLVAMPVAHIAGTAYALFGLHTGGRLVITGEFDAGRVLALLSSSSATHMLLAPAALRMLVEHPDAPSTNLSGFRYLTYGGSPISLSLLESALALLGCGFVQMYGMTEASGGVCALAPEDHHAEPRERLLSAGCAMPGAELAVADRDGKHLALGSVGEVVVRSAAVMAGYWHLPEATAEAIDARGWLRTGDIGFLDENGYLYIRDRAKDTIVSGGENVYPAEVENLLASHPDIADAAVIGIPSERWGEEVKAVVVVRPGRTLDTDALIAWAKERIAPFKAPKSVDIVTELPRNAGGKVLRRLLREPYWSNCDRRVG